LIACAHEALRRLAQIYGSRFGQSLQAGSEVHRVAQRGHLPAFAANLRHHRKPGIDADTHLRLDAMSGFDGGASGGEAFVNQ
jgi:hypothetical protein